MAKSDLIIHPVRLRILQTMFDGRELTTSQLCELLPDVSKATVYRQVAVLAEGGLLEVADEQRVRGAVERRYRVQRARVSMSVEDAAEMSLEDHRRGFTAVVTALLAEFDVYLDREDADPVADSVSYRQFSLWLSPEERDEMIEQMRAVVRSKVDNGPAPGRTRHLLTPILIPVEGPGASLPR